MVQHWVASEDRVFGIGKGWSKNTSLTELETRKWLYLLVSCFLHFGYLWVNVGLFDSRCFTTFEDP